MITPEIKQFLEKHFQSTDIKHIVSRTEFEYALLRDRINLVSQICEIFSIGDGTDARARLESMNKSISGYNGDAQISKAPPIQKRFKRTLLTRIFT